MNPLNPIEELSFLAIFTGFSVICGASWPVGLVIGAAVYLVMSVFLDWLRER